MADRPRRVPLADLKFGLSPRLSRVDENHVAALRQVFDDLPPILITRDRIVIDGAHRVAAARAAGRSHIRALVFDGDEGEAFAEAVKANIAHGKPLSLREREVAARTLLERQPEWSDRRVAATCGLSAGVVATVRRSTAEGAQSNKRVGRDGRVRPADAAQQRLQVASLLAGDLQQPVRKVAAAAGCSPATVLDVRDRLRRGEDPIPPKLRRPDIPSFEHSRAGWAPDHAFDDAAHFAQWFKESSVDDSDWRALVAQVPLSRLYEVADEATKRAESWQRFARAISERAQAKRRP